MLTSLLLRGKVESLADARHFSQPGRVVQHRLTDGQRQFCIQAICYASAFSAFILSCVKGQPLLLTFAIIWPPPAICIHNVLAQSTH